MMCPQSLRRFGSRSISVVCHLTTITMSDIKVKNIRPPRQKNIDQNEAEEISALVLNQYKTDKLVWGNEFWKKLEGKGELSKDRSFGTLRNFARNVSNGKTRFTWDQLFSGLPKYGHSTPVATSKAEKEKWRSRTALLWTAKSVKSVMEKLSKESSNIEDEDFWTTFQSKHKIVHTAAQIRDLFNNYDRDYLKKCDVEDETIAELNCIKKTLDWSAFDLDDDEDTEDGNEQLGVYGSIVLNPEDPPSNRNETEDITAESIVKANHSLNKEGSTDQSQPSTVGEEKDPVTHREIVTNENNRPTNDSSKKVSPVGRPMPLCKKRALDDEYRPTAIKIVKSDLDSTPESSGVIREVKAAESIELKTDKLLKEVNEWWKIFELVSVREAPHRHLFKYLKDTVMSIKVLGGCSDEHEDCLKWIQHIVRYRFANDESKEHHLAVAIVRCMCLARKSLELSMTKDEILDLKITMHSSK